jgi:hypothetical protein
LLAEINGRQAGVHGESITLSSVEALERSPYRLLVDHEYWVCLCFQSRDQKEEFLAKAGWADLGEKYVDGLALAERLGVDVKPVPLTTKVAPKSPKSLREEVMDDA